MTWLLKYRFLIPCTISNYRVLGQYSVHIETGVRKEKCPVKQDYYHFRRGREELKSERLAIRIGENDTFY